MPPPLIVNGNATQNSKPFLSVNGGNSVVPEQPTFVQKATTAVKNYAVDSVKQSKNVLDTITTQNPITTVKNAAKGVYNDFKEPIQGGIQKITDGLAQAVPTLKLNPLNPLGIVDLSNPNTVAGIAKVISGMAESAFSPITGGFHVASQIPGLKQVADTINIPFSATGFAGSWATGKAIDWIPDSILPPSSKAILKQPLQDLGSLAAQTVIGGKIMEKIGDFASKGQPVTPETAKEIVDQSKIETQDHHAFQSEGLTPPKLEVNAPENGSVFDQSKQVKYTSILDQNGPKESASVPPDTKVARVTKVASDINTTLVEKGFETMKPETLATYDPIIKADQVKRVATLMDKNIKDAQDMATGKKPVEAGIHPQVLFNAIEADAVKNSDVKMLQKLARSPLATQLSEAGQTLSAHGFNDNPNSPVRIIQDVVKAREIKSPLKVKRVVVDEIQSEIKKSAPTKQTWSDFVESIKCGY